MAWDPMVWDLPKYYTTSDRLALVNKKNAIQGDHCVWETQYRDTTVFRSHDPKYGTTSDWLAP